MTTQLRLVEPPVESTRTTSTAPARRARGSARGRTAVATRTPRTGRRAAGWGDWHLDARTRRVGRAGVARARRALEEVVEHELSRAS